MEGSKESVWDIPVENYKGAHFAVYPQRLIEPMIRAGCPVNGIILDPFLGAGTTALVALENARKFIGIEINQKHVDLAYGRIRPLLLQDTLNKNRSI